MPNWAKDLLWLLWALLLPVLVAGCGRENPVSEVTDFDRELHAIDSRLAALADLGGQDPISEDRLLEIVWLRYRRGSLTDMFDDLESTRHAIDAAATLVQADDLLLLEAQLQFKLHRIRDAKSVLGRLDSKLAGSGLVMAMQADIDLHEGRLDEARRKYEAAIEAERAWHFLARLAHLKYLSGDVVGADQLYAEAQDEISAKEMRSYAWVEVQRGLLDFRRGRYAEALIHYQRADTAYSGYWFVRSHIAEVQGALGRFEQAAEIYREVIAKYARPEVMQALGDLHARAGELELARAWHQQALSAYLESARRGEGRYFHHLAAYYSDVEPNGREAVKWAGQDVAQREGTTTRQALAWALHIDGQRDLAEQEIRRAIASGTQDARLFSQAATILKAAGHLAEGMAFDRRAREMSHHDDDHHDHHDDDHHDHHHVDHHDHHHVDH